MIKGLSRKYIIRTMIFAVICGLLIGCDQIVKGLVAEKISYTNGSVVIIKNFFEIVHWHNDGGMWGLFPGKVLPLAIIATVAAVILLILAANTKHWLSQLSLFMILAGAVGNVIDRFKLGYVIDFLSFNFWGYLFPSFNIADCCVVVGAILMIIFVLFISGEDDSMFIDGSPLNRKGRKNKKDE